MKCYQFDIPLRFFPSASSSNILDLRFVPDEVSFDEDTPRDEATRIPPDYKPPKAFYSKARMDTRVEIEWDKDDPKRAQEIERMIKEGLEADDVSAYLASASEDEEEGEEGREEQEGQADGYGSSKPSAKRSSAAAAASACSEDEEEQSG